MLNEMEIISVTENNLLLTYLADPYMLAAEYWALFLSPQYLIGICSLVQRVVICSKSPHTGLYSEWILIWIVQWILMIKYWAFMLGNKRPTIS